MSNQSIESASSQTDRQPSPRLQALDFSRDIDRLSEDFTGREWVFAEIDKWMLSQNEIFFILTGEAGVGKSAIAAQLTKIRKDNIAAHHFCIAGRNSTIVPGTVLRSIAAQLGKSLNGYGDALANTIKPTYVSVDVKIHVGTLNGGQITGVVLENLTLADPKQELESLLTAPLSKMPAPAHPVIILLDSLDEAFTYNANENLVTLLASLDNLPDWVRIFVTTRPEKRVLSYFGSIPKHVVAAESQMNRDDLLRYAGNRVQKQALYERLISVPKPLKPDDFVAQVAELADGNFLFTKILLNDIESGVQPLDNIAALPRGLDEIYNQFLLRIAPEWETKYQPLLAILAVAREPLTFEQLRYFGDGSARLSGHRMSDTLLVQALPVLRQFLDESGEPGEEKYQLFHQSLRDYLGDRERSLRWACPPRDAHGVIADYILENFSSNWNQCDDYGLRHLPVHLKQAGRVSELDKLLVNFSWMDAILQRLGINALLTDYELTDNSQAKLIHVALRQESHILSTDPRSLYIQMRNRLWQNNNSQLDQLLESSCLRPNFPWLRAASRLPLETSLVRTFSGHTETTNAAVFVDHDHRMISGSWDGTVRIWEVQTGRQLRSWDTGSAVDSLVVAPDGSIVVTRDQDDRIQVWNGNTGKQKYRLSEKGEILGITVDGHGLLFSRKKKIFLWDLAMQKPVRLWNSPCKTISSFLATPDGQYLLAADYEGAVIAWKNDWQPDMPVPDKPVPAELPSLRVLKPARKTGGPDIFDSSTVLAVSEDSRILAAVEMNGFVWLYDLEKDQVLSEWRADTRGYRAVGISSRSNWLVTGGVGSTVQLWNLKNPQRYVGLNGHTGHVMQLTMASDGQHVVSAGGEGNVCLWELNSDRFSGSVAGHEGEVVAVACSVDGVFGLSGGEDGCLHIWDLATHTQVSSIPKAHSGSITSVAFLDPDHVVSGGADGTVSIWNVHTGKIILQCQDREDREDEDDYIDPPAFFSIFADSNRVLAAAKSFEHIRIWDAKEQKPLKVISNDSASVSGAFIQDGAALFVAGDEVEIIPLTGKKRRLKLSAKDSAKEYDVVRITGDGQHAIMGEIEGSITICDLARPGPFRKLSDHRNYVHALAISPDGRWLVSGGWDCTLRIWDLASEMVVSRYSWQLPLECADMVETSTGVLRLIVGDAHGNILFFEIEPGP